MRLPVSYIGRSDAPLKVMPVDYVTEAITAAAERPEAVGRRYISSIQSPLRRWRRWTCSPRDHEDDLEYA